MIRYFGDYLTSTLENYRLKVALPSKLNDPFDFALATEGVVTIEEEIKNLYDRLDDPAFYSNLREAPELSHFSDAELKKIVLKNPLPAAQALVDDQDGLREHFKIETHKIADNNTRVLCFSSDSIEKDSDILMWSHYGYSHQGYRVHFDTTFLQQNGIQARVVNYENKRVSIPLGISSSNPLFPEKIEQSMHTKGEIWSYEKETRFLISPSLCMYDQETKMEYVKFPPESLLRIDTGIRSEPVVVEKIVEHLERKDFAHVELYEADLDESEFSIKYNRKK
ncbi:DUF2971 domain-containing protein [Pelagicoccus mobilis]|uniref:DUF2971 domain-containing protein n=1 Tax=Pelagicoccus mobilis TaxID=415221 RepID=A0A934S3X7_9BACT|nr:DUF2971 domain-containing protein [Pelagicoccus mobilis]MBK1880740.1 DUF2971 domain-containing protein [Pelagicoccus mobilis]